MSGCPIALARGFQLLVSIDLAPQVTRVAHGWCRVRALVILTAPKTSWRGPIVQPLTKRAANDQKWMSNGVVDDPTPIHDVGSRATSARVLSHREQPTAMASSPASGAVAIEGVGHPQWRTSVVSGLTLPPLLWTAPNGKSRDFYACCPVYTHHLGKSSPTDQGIRSPRNGLPIDKPVVDLSDDPAPFFRCLLEIQ